ncbi:MAG: chemotaxis protein CheX [Spirochaetota bacterium]
MKAEFVNIFITSAVNVFKQEMKIHLSRKALSKKNSPAPNLPVSIIFGITGYLTGQVVYSMDDDFAYKLAQALLPNSLPAEVKKMENSAVSEIANIITGQASIILAGEKNRINLTPPAVLRATDLVMDFLQVPTVSLSLISEIGELEINIALIENE